MVPTAPEVAGVSRHRYRQKQQQQQQEQQLPPRLTPYLRTGRVAEPEADETDGEPSGEATEPQRVVDQRVVHDLLVVGAERVTMRGCYQGQHAAGCGAAVKRECVASKLALRGRQAHAGAQGDCKRYLPRLPQPPAMLRAERGRAHRGPAELCKEVKGPVPCGGKVVAIRRRVHEGELVKVLAQVHEPRREPGRAASTTGDRGGQMKKRSLGRHARVDEARSRGRPYGCHTAMKPRARRTGGRSASAAWPAPVEDDEEAHHEAVHVPDI